MNQILLKWLEYMAESALVFYLFNKDALAADQCQRIAYKLNNELEKFLKHFKNIHRNPATDLPKLLELRSIIQELHQQQRGLLIKPRCLCQAMNQSEKIFDRIDIPGPANTPNMLAAELTVIWGLFSSRTYSPKTLAKIQKILNKFFLLRWTFSLLSWIKPVLSKIPYRLRIERAPLNEDII